MHDTVFNPIQFKRKILAILVCGVLATVFKLFGNHLECKGIAFPLGGFENNVSALGYFYLGYLCTAVAELAYHNLLSYF
jgi:hypothetical protein